MEHVVGKKIKKNIKVVMGDPNLVEEGELFLGYAGNEPILGTRIAGAPSLTTLAFIVKVGEPYFMGNLGEGIINEIFGSGSGSRKID